MDLKNIEAQKKTWNKIAEAMLKADTTGDFEYLMDSPEKVKKVLKANPTRKKIIRYVLLSVKIEGGFFA